MSASHKRYRIGNGILGAIVLGLSFAVPAQNLPAPIQSEYMKTLAGGFEFYRGQARYQIHVLLLKPLPPSAVVIAQFENPAPGGAPFEVRYAPKPDEKDFGIMSPTLACVINLKNYMIRVLVYEDGGRQNLLATHEQLINLSLADGYFAQLKLALPVCAQ